MKTRVIPSRASVFRHSVHPVSFRGGKTFDPRNLLNICDLPDGSLETSMAWDRYLPSVKDVHSYGCRLAHQRNQAKQTAGKYNEKYRQIYCGAYETEVLSIRRLVGNENLDEIASADVVHQPEDGEIAHVRVIIRVRDDGDLDRENTKTAIIHRIWHAFRGPLIHVCPCDAEIPNHPSSTLATGPAGPYVDRRSRLVQLWSLFRFHCGVWIRQHDL